ncbi:MAG: LacI family DNA-binding transcriptional regulator [Pirellulales bacterium]|nr:LacI family DNA-binding transcriptional regulator [Pirellulales bacterium]
MRVSNLVADMTRRAVRQIDIARRLGVSQAAVSLVLGGKPSERIGREMRERIEQAAKEMGYQPNLAARQLKGVRSGLLGVLIGIDAPPVLFDRVSALESAALARGYRVLVGQIGHDPSLIEQYVNDFVGRGLDGVVCMTHEDPKHPATVPELLARIPNVVYLRRPAVEHGCYVHIDAADCIHQAVDHLETRGRRRIGMILLNEYDQANTHRRWGYVESMKRHGWDVDKGLIWVGDESLQPRPHEVSNAKADEVVEELVGRSAADAIIAINDDWAAQLIKAVKRRGLRVPEDVAVVGQGNFKIASFFDPEITTLDPRNDAFADAAIHLLIHMIDHDEPPPEPSITIKPRLIVRQST